MTQKFKEIAHHHIGCMIQSKDGSIRSMNIYDLPEAFSSICNFKPILIPMDKMSEEDKIKLVHILYARAPYPVPVKVELHKPIRTNADGFRYSVILESDEELTTDKQSYFSFSTEQFLFLHSKHYNVFNLPADQYIDATTLNPNPYEQ